MTRALALRAASGVLSLLVVVALGSFLAANGRGATAVDAAWAGWMRSIHTAGADAVARFLDVAGGPLWATVTTVAIVAMLVVLRRYLAAIAVGLAIGLTSLLNTALKALFARPRPPVSDLAFAGYSYPSGHSSAAVALAVALTLTVRVVWVRAAAVSWAVLMLLDRTYLGAHWLTDVLGAALEGAGVALVVAAVVALVARRRVRAP